MALGEEKKNRHTLAASMILQAFDWDKPRGFFLFFDRIPS